LGEENFFDVQGWTNAAMPGMQKAAQKVFFPQRSFFYFATAPFI